MTTSRAAAVPVARGLSQTPFRPRRVARRLNGSADGLHKLLALGLAMFFFYALFLSHLHRVITPMLFFLFLIWWRLSYESARPGQSLKGRVAVMAIYFGVVLEAGRLIAPAQGFQAGIVFERLVALFPLSAVVGWQLVRTGRYRLYCRVLLVVALLTVPLALYEYASGTSLLNTNHLQYVRNSQTRAIVGADHPLVLATLFLALIPIARYALDRFQRVACVVLFLGIVATGSNGPSGIGLFVLVVCLFPLAARIVLSNRVFFTTLFAAIVFYIWFGVTYLWSTELPGTDTTAVSNQYRSALYYLLPQIIHARPFGYGLGGIPAQTWYFSTEVSGLLDVSVTVDSDVVYAAAQFGVIALGLYAFFCWMAITAIPQHHAIGLSSISVSLAGFFLALHAWESLGSFWLLGIGACAAVMRSDDPALSWQGLYSRQRVDPGPGEDNRSAPEQRARDKRERVTDLGADRV
ncbi:hypothetical protein M6D93_05010 [Jatrophihabitans telluris]|uniref:O-antigen ligase domain-containing protein n=1 Tax=Jatrophihabitans telluris TaxID=2038343 RepID=A0ABY4R0Y0_9ACTN|nr:hypothetical protein [Jatrophihabitans telluris]UQX89365.1 hypothetical protein M6D93_05010 [Jatrophihabitans telluris]